MKYLLITILFYFTINSPPTQAQNTGDKEELKKQVVLQGGVSVGTTVVKKAKIGLGQERIIYAKNKYSEERTALITAIEEGEKVVIKAREKIALAKTVLEEEKRTNKISERVYNARKTRLEMIEEKAKVLEYNISKN